GAAGLERVFELRIEQTGVENGVAEGAGVLAGQLQIGAAPAFEQIVGQLGIGIAQMRLLGCEND
ncbi:MAG TPA: hypothetical protein VGE07_01035, partial [Herpetosiphonaceae bacterium]